MFAVVVLAVNCEPEADPALLLPGYGYGYGYPLVYGHPYSLGKETELLWIRGPLSPSLSPIPLPFSPSP